MSKTITEALIEVLERERAAGKQTTYLSEESAAYLQSLARPTGAPDRPPTRPAQRRPDPGPAPQSPAPPPAPPVPAGPPVAQLPWDDLQTRVASCRLCPLCDSRTQAVFGAGDPNADLMFIGEGPGRDEDEQGIPFVGAAGQLLTKMIQAMQFTRDTVFIANIVKCRPPRNRNPEDEEAAACLPYLERQIQLVSPKVIVLLGAVPVRYLLGLKGISRLRGQWQEYKGIPVMPTFHPAFLLRAQDRKKEVWHDLQEVMKRLGKDPRNTPRGTK